MYSLSKTPEEAGSSVKHVEREELDTCYVIGHKYQPFAFTLPISS